jgi:hypothetical protein
MRYLCAVVAVLVAVFSGSAKAETWKVGPDEKAKNISGIIDNAAPGDVIELTGDIKDSFILRKSGTAEKPIVIRSAEGKRYKIDFASARNGIETRGDYYTFENLELTNAQFRGIFHCSEGIVIRNCYFHDNQNGIMGADSTTTGDITIEGCEFYHNGSGIYAHQMYLASWKPGATAIVQFNYIHDSTGGVNIKSRMPHNVIRYNWIENAQNYECDIVDSDEAPDAPALRPINTEFIGNVVITNAEGGNPHHKMNLGSDQPRSPGGEGTFTIANNTFVCRRASNEVHMIRIGGNIKEADFYNNIFVGPGLKEFGVLVIEDTSGDEGKPGSKGHLGKLVGKGNFVADNAINVPEEFAGTVRGKDPGFTDYDKGDLHLAEGSPCIGAGDVSAPFAAKYAPIRSAKPFMRPVGEKMDIGAFGMTVAGKADEGPAVSSGMKGGKVENAERGVTVYKHERLPESTAAVESTGKK